MAAGTADETTHITLDSTWTADDGLTKQEMEAAIRVFDQSHVGG